VTSPTSPTSPKELRAAVVENRAQLQEALHSAHSTWEKQPDSAAEGEESWSPKQVVEHMIGTEWYFTDLISQACGAPAMGRANVDASTPATAAASAARIGATCDGVLRHVSDGDLPKTWETRRGTRTVSELLQLMNSHAADHLIQLKSACP